MSALRAIEPQPRLRDITASITIAGRYRADYRIPLPTCPIETVSWFVNSAGWIKAVVSQTGRLPTMNLATEAEYNALATALNDAAPGSITPPGIRHV